MQYYCYSNHQPVPGSNAVEPEPGREQRRVNVLRRVSVHLLCTFACFQAVRVKMSLADELLADLYEIGDEADQENEAQVPNYV